MLTNPHDTCAQIINTLRMSGLTYTLNETPYSVYLTLRKKFIKEYIPQPQHNTNEHPVVSQDDKIKEHEDQIAQLQEALKTKSTNTMPQSISYQKQKQKLKNWIT